MEARVTDSLTVIARSVSEALEGLDACVERLQRLAMQEKSRGILVTKRAAGHYTLELSHAVPYGLTLECTNDDVSWQPPESVFAFPLSAAREADTGRVRFS